MIDGVQLRLFAGPGVPRPVPADVIDALISVEVTAAARDAGQFQLRFRLDNKSPLHTLFLLAGSSVVRVFRVIVVVVVKGRTEVLIDGVVTHQQAVPGDSPGRSELVVSGEDLSAVMDWTPLDGVPFPATPLAGRVLALLLKYSVLGIVPNVIPAIIEDVPSIISRIPRQQGSDRRYIRLLADIAGYVFYIEPGPTPGVSRAYWGPEIKIGEVQPALNVNFDVHSNAEGLNFSYDADNAKLPILCIQDENTKLPIEIPVLNITPLNPPLGGIPAFPREQVRLHFTEKLSFGTALMQGLAYAAQTAEAVSGTGTLDTVRYGEILKPRRLVGVRGVGTAFDGLHYVQKVTHQIRRGEYKQSFELSRNGLVSTVPRVSA